MPPTSKLVVTHSVLPSPPSDAHSTTTSTGFAAIARGLRRGASVKMRGTDASVTKPRTVFRSVKEIARSHYKILLGELLERFAEQRQLDRIVQSASAGVQKFELVIGTMVRHETRGPGQIIDIDFNDPRGKPYTVRFARGEVHKYNADSTLKLISLVGSEAADSSVARYPGNSRVSSSRRASVTETLGLESGDETETLSHKLDIDGQPAIHRAVVRSALKARAVGNGADG